MDINIIWYYLSIIFNLMSENVYFEDTMDNFKWSSSHIFYEHLIIYSVLI